MNTVAGASQARATAQTFGLPILALLIVLACGAYGLAALWPVLDAAWSDVYGAFSHGYLVLVLCISLAVRYWRAAPPPRLEASWSAAWALVVIVFALVGMELLLLNSSRTIVLPLVFLAAVATTFGWTAARVLFWPSVFLYFALPQWWAINGLLQSLTSALVGAFVNLTGLPAYVEGNFISVPAGMFEIASGCSGLSYLVAALSLAGFYALMYLERRKSRLQLLAAAAAAAILSNLVRIYALIVIGIATDMQHHLVRVEHFYFGWVLFAVSMMPVLWLARKLDAADAAAAPAPQTAASMSVGRSVLPAALVSGLILLLPKVVTIAAVDVTMQAPALPDRVGPWSRHEPALSAWQPAFANAQQDRARYVDTSEFSVEAYRASYLHQTHDARVIHGENDFFGPEWRLAEQRSTDVNAQSVARVIESRGYLEERERLIWSWYVVAGQAVTTKLGAKLHELRGLAQRRRDASAFAISTECIPDCAAGRARLGRFMQESAASLQ